MVCFSLEKSELRSSNTSGAIISDDKMIPSFLEDGGEQRGDGCGGNSCKDKENTDVINE